MEFVGDVDLAGGRQVIYDLNYRQRLYLWGSISEQFAQCGDHCWGVNLFSVHLRFIFAKGK